MTYRKRAFTALVAGALALPFLATPASAAPGDTATPPVQDIATFCTNPTSPQFSDVGANDTFALAIRCIATAGITVGGPEGRPVDQYGPNLNIRRGQMATFIARLLDAADDRDRGNQIQDLPGYDGSNQFSDVPNNFIHVDNINRLADAGVVNGGVAGRPATTYSPNDLVSRAQMASFINRAAAFAMSQNPDNSGTSAGYSAGNADYFVDDENVQIHEPNINGVASKGIVIGVAPASDRRYNPTGAVTRAQMAGFISRTLSQLFDDDRIFSLLEIFTESFAAADRADVSRVATPDGDGSTAANSRDFRLDQLDPAVDYRVTLLKCESVNRGADDLVTFTQETVNGQRLATTGNPDADIVQVNGGAPSNPGSATVTNTAVAKPNAQGVLTFRIEGDTAECVTAIVYINGGAGKSLEDGGSSPRLEVDAQGRPVEPFGIAGDTTFTAPAGPSPSPSPSPGPGDAAPTITDARVATDAAQATGGAGGMATNTASNGDVFRLTFNEAVATDSASATRSATFQDADGTRFTAQCVQGGTAASAGNTPATCTLSANGTVLTIQLNADPTLTGGNAVASFPLTITALTGFVDADEGRQPVSLASGDTSVTRESDTQPAPDPGP